MLYLHKPFVRVDEIRKTLRCFNLKRVCARVLSSFDYHHQQKEGFLKGYLEGLISIINDKRYLWKGIVKGSLASSTTQIFYIWVTGRVD
jgi:hypothetical protein